MRKLGWVLALTVLTAGVLSAQAVGPEGIIKGVEHTRESSIYPYDSQDALDALEDLAATGATWVSIVPVWWQDDTGSSTIYWMEDLSPTDAEVCTVINRAHALDLQVFLKPEVHLVSELWQGRHDPPGKSWFYSYWSYIKRFADIAQATGCELFCVGAELDSSADETWEETQWAGIINGVRSRYLGPVIYAADWRSYHSIPFWDSLDYLGINAYFPLDADSVPDFGSSPIYPSVEYFAKVWKKRWILDIESYRENTLGYDDTTRPVIFTEIGYRSLAGASEAPWDDQMTGNYSDGEQRNCYIAGFHSLLGKPWFAGWFWLRGVV